MASQSDITFCAAAAASLVVSLDDSVAEQEAGDDSDDDSVLSEVIPMRSSVVVFSFRSAASSSETRAPATGSQRSAEETQLVDGAARRFETADTEPIQEQQALKRKR
jgi:hypothetical protein